MNSTFEGLPEDKRKLIIDACMEEFAQNGYEKASTNTIVKNAGISKGILFHYFGNKKNLYLYILDYAVELFTQKFYSLDLNVPRDLIDKIIYYGFGKLKVYYELPVVSKLIMEAFISIPDELKGEVLDRYQKIYDQNMPLLLQDIDKTKFREGINKNKAVELVMLCMDGINAKYINMFKRDPEKSMMNLEDVFNEMKEYFEILKGGLYGSP
ncbi:TetR/AcrR family transcriptional regulator [Pseudobacteroides cellulosolvens]|uniref:Transcriptional regulator, TetR family n=1 Tax=Pseudobacteroides cellulosolvens ATCC 35603 = DSM 2933 TaxID=398512 RepID=A0A0L6JP07_9FIRM|nr:TetR/AcrR family transcriptional regulator [Pseudobacteroides cellulosolvens]KNY27519.1 transcriptional regulator, TetR family [Pseudobacteroides cellulosolvens ATCC 35603 = DSM 2933]